MSDKTKFATDAPAGAALIAQAMDRREGAGRYKAMQSIMDWDRSRLAYRAMKRMFDILFSGAALVLIAIPSLVLAAAIRLESEESPFYSQIRVGRTRSDGSLTTFRMWKFRSMYRDADERLAELKEQNEIAGAMFKMKNDPRVTKIGKFIRKHSIDEFPQFLNVFLGQMSVVGPRPPLPNEVSFQLAPIKTHRETATFRFRHIPQRYHPRTCILFSAYRRCTFGEGSQVFLGGEPERLHHL